MANENLCLVHVLLQKLQAEMGRLACKFKLHARIQRGTGDLDPSENHKAIGFLSNTGLNSIKNHKACN